MIETDRMESGRETEIHLIIRRKVIKLSRNSRLTFSVIDIPSLEVSNLCYSILMIISCFTHDISI